MNRSGFRIGWLDGTLGLAGIATLLIGLSFVRGALEENEPQAARVGTKVFGGMGLSLLLAALLVRRWRHRI